MAPLRAAVAVALLALVALTGATLPSTTTVAYSPSSTTTGLGVAGSPSVRTLFISYYSNWAFNPAFSLTNTNYNVIRAWPARRLTCEMIPTAAASRSGRRRDLQPNVQHRLAGRLPAAVPDAAAVRHHRLAGPARRRGLEYGDSRRAHRLHSGAPASSCAPGGRWLRQTPAPLSRRPALWPSTPAHMHKLP